jgi:DNA segregation ATPase FtsK/SpoIIIE, S-DNA-T family
MGKRTKISKHNNDVNGIILITIGLLMTIGIFLTSSSGIVGNLFKSLLVALFGLGAFIFPFIIIFIGVCYIIKQGQISFKKKFYGIIILLMNTLLLIQLINMDKYYVNNNITGGFKLIYYSSSIIHGGFICYLIDIPLFKLFGSIGCYIIFTAIYLISFILICEVSVNDIINMIKIKKNANNDGEKPTEVVATGGSKMVAFDSEKDGYVKNITNRIKIIDFMKSSHGSENSVTKVETSPLLKAEDKNDDSINEELEKELNEKRDIEDLEYDFPLVQLLNPNNLSKLNKEDKKDLINNANKLEETLASFGVEAKVIQVTKGPSVTRFELQPNAGVKVSKIVNLSDDIALSLASSGVRIEAPIPGKSAVGIEVPNKDLTPVFIREVIESDTYVNFNKNLAFCLGKDIGGNCVVADLTKMPHLLIAGATGSGKSVCINTLIISLLYKYSPSDVKLLMVDPKVVELNIYNGIPHLLIPVVTEPKKAAGALNWAVNEMTRRYKLFADNNVRNVEGYNELTAKGKVVDKLPWIVMIIDELADLMMVCPNDIEDYIGRLAQMARAAGMHLVIATQRPSVDVITGVIKANIPSRISFSVSSQIDSRTIIDVAGAEKLLGKGDMLYYPVGEAKPIRIQGAFISEEEVEKVVKYIKKQSFEPEYENGLLSEIDTDMNAGDSNYDELLDEAVRIAIEAKQASTSLLQRRLRIGYNRAARIIEQMEEKGIISGRDGSKPRQILISKEDL